MTTAVIPETTPPVILEIFYRGSSNLSSPTWLGIQCLFFLFLPTWTSNPFFFFFTFYLKRDTSWIPHQVRNDNTNVIPEIFYRESSIYFLFLVITDSNKNRFFIFFLFKRINTSWIPHQVRNDKKYFLDSRFRGNDNTSVILESIPTVILESTPTVILENTPTVIPEILYRGSSNLSSPTWLGIQFFFIPTKIIIPKLIFLLINL